jgi:hypothetical protein
MKIQMEYAITLGQHKKMSYLWFLGTEEEVQCKSQESIFNRIIA